MRYRIACITLIAAFFTMSPLQAFAKQIVNINVPVHLSHLYKDVAQFRVLCRAQNPSDQIGGYKSVTVPISNGKYDGVVHVKIEVNDADVPQVTHWECRLDLYYGSGPYGGARCTYLQVNGHPDECKVKPGTTFVRKVSGPLRLGGAPLVRSRVKLRR